MNVAHGNDARRRFGPAGAARCGRADKSCLAAEAQCRTAAGMVGLALWTAHGLATAWPYELHPLLIVLVIAMSGVMFRAGDLLFMRRRRRRLAGWWRAGARLAAVPVGVTAGCFLFPD